MIDMSVISSLAFITSQGRSQLLTRPSSLSKSVRRPRKVSLLHSTRYSPRRQFKRFPLSSGTNNSERGSLPSTYGSVCTLFSMAIRLARHSSKKRSLLLHYANFSSCIHQPFIMSTPSLSVCQSRVQTPTKPLAVTQLPPGHVTQLRLQLPTRSLYVHLSRPHRFLSFPLSHLLPLHLILNAVLRHHPL